MQSEFRRTIEEKLVPLALDPIVGALALAIATALYFSQEKGSEQTFHNVAEELSFSFGKPNG